MPTLLDSYSEIFVDDKFGLRSGGFPYAGQQFTTPNNGISYTLDSAKFYMQKLGVPTGNMTVKIYANTGSLGSGTPTGSALATSDNSDVSTYTASPLFSLITYSFSGANRITLSPNTNYFLVGFYNSGDALNLPRIGEDVAVPYSKNDSYSADGSSWTADTFSFSFYVYGEPPASGPTNLKTLDTNVKANIKAYNTNVLANIKSVNTNT